MPGAAEDVVIDVPGTLTVNYATITTTIASLSVVDGLAIAGASSIAGALTLNSGTVSLGGAMTVDGA